MLVCLVLSKVGQATFENFDICGDMLLFLFMLLGLLSELVDLLHEFPDGLLPGGLPLLILGLLLLDHLLEFLHLLRSGALDFSDFVTEVDIAAPARSPTA